jgi:hypothetical protein
MFTIEQWFIIVLRILKEAGRKTPFDDDWTGSDLGNI